MGFIINPVVELFIQIQNMLYDALTFENFDHENFVFKHTFICTVAFVPYLLITVLHL